MNLDRPPLFQRLDPARRILISGAGGGFDVFSGLPLFFELEEAGKEVFLGNLSFTNLYGVTGRKPSPAVVEVGPDAGGPQEYFPERYLTEWFRDRGREVTVLCFHRTGVAPLTEAYAAVVRELDLDAVVLVDGGTDSLMRGDEVGLGTPQEDLASIAAVDALELDHRYLVCLGFGIDAFHGVSHALFLENTAALIRQGAYLGSFSILEQMPAARRYLDAVAHVSRAMPTAPSIVSSSIVSALEGEYGDHHTTLRTHGSRLWINPLMTIYWCYELASIAAACLYLESIRETRTYSELSVEIGRFRASLAELRDSIDLPV